MDKNHAGLKISIRQRRKLCHHFSMGMWQCRRKKYWFASIATTGAENSDTIQHRMLDSKKIQHRFNPHEHWGSAGNAGNAGIFLS